MSRNYLAIILIVFTALASCKKSSSKKPTPPPTKPDPGNVYVVGQVNGTTATIWKNGVASTLDNGKLANVITSTSAASVFVADTDVYITGTEMVYETNPLAVYWKNGKITELPRFNTTIKSEPYSIAVSGNDVYVSGWQSNKAGGVVVWKNGLPDTSFPGINNFENSMFVSGSDVYICGEKSFVNDPYNDSLQAVYWKNGAMVQLTDRTFESVAEGIFVKGNDVYVTGWRNSPTTSNQAVYWKNGVMHDLPGLYSSGRAIFVSGNDVYITGEQAVSATNTNAEVVVWKNGVSTILTTSLNAPTNESSSIYVVGSDVYVAGNTYLSNDSRSSAVLWKNGTATLLGSPNSFATGVFVK